ncbi:MAG: amino acid permease [Armatimonadetes bacterium]|nr:amino acid permease [Armatimonadota bacterium]
MAEATQPNEGQGGHLVRQIGFWSGVAVVVGSTIGSGIFKNPADIAAKLPGPLPMLMVWLVGGLVVLCGALTLAEVGGAFPYSGGHYVFIREAFGRMPAFLFGWAQLLLIRPSSIGAVAIVFGQYALRMFGVKPEDPNFTAWSAYLAAGAILIVGTANYRGVKFGTGIQNLTTVLKVGGIIVLVLLAFAIGLPKTGGHFSPLAPGGSFDISMFGLALVSALWAYDGWSDGAYVGGELVDPKKNLPRVIVMGTAIIIAVYLLANLAYLSVLSVADMSKSSIIAADTMSVLVGSFGVTFITATVMFSTFGTVNGSMLTSPRIFFAMAEDKLFFEPVARVHPRFQTPYVSVAICGGLGTFYVVVASLFTGSQAFSTLTDAFVIAIVPFYALAVGSVFVFRRRERKRQGSVTNGDAALPDSLADPPSPGHLETHPHPYNPPVHTPLYPVVPGVFIASTVFLLTNSMLDSSSRTATLLTLGLVLAGAPVYYGTIGRR